MIGDTDPKSGDFDDELRRVDPRDVEIVEPSAERAGSIHIVSDADEALTAGVGERRAGPPTRLIEAGAIELFRVACEESNSFHDACRRLQEKVPPGEEENFRPLVWALGYHQLGLSRGEGRERAGGPFGAMWEIEGRRFPPALDALPEGTFDDWEQAFQAVGLPVSRARLGDLLWTVRFGVRPDERARAAIASYVALSSDDRWHRMERVQCLERALELARELRDDDLLGLVSRRMLDVIRADLADEDESPGVSLSLLRALLGLRAPVETDQLDALLVEADTRYGQDSHIFDSVAELRARIAADAAAQRAIRLEQVQRWRTQAGSAHGMLRVHRLETALDLARAHGLSEQADELRRELQQIGPAELDLKAISAEIEFPAEEVEAYISSFVDDRGWRESLMRFGAHGPPGGSHEELQRQLVEERQEHPLQFLMTRVIVAPDRATALFRADDDAKHERLALAERRAQYARMWSLFAIEALKAIAQRHGRPSSEELTGFFETPLIPGDIAERIARCFELFWDDDYDECGHMVVPRLEAVIRELARRLGIPIFNEPVGEKPGGVRTLGGILAALEPAFDDPSWHAYLMNLLTDQLGLNLRNAVAHGLRRRVEALDAALLLHAACFVRLLEVSQKESGNTES